MRDGDHAGDAEVSGARCRTSEGTESLCHHFKIIRFYQRGGSRTLITGLSLAEAQAHCSNPETSSSTATGYRERKRTAERGPWFDGYDHE